MEIISCVGGTLPHAVRSVHGTVAFHDLQLPQDTQENNQIFKINVEETV